MTSVKCPHCGKKLFEALGSYRISVNCRGCKKIVLCKSESHEIELMQKVFENQIAPTGMRVNNTR